MEPRFPRGGGTNPPGGHEHTILPNFPKTSMKLKEFVPGGGDASRILLCRSTTDDIVENAVRLRTVKMSIITITYLEFQSRYHSVTY